MLRRQVKQRKDSIAEYEKGGRVDLAEKEKEEMSILQTYFPPARVKKKSGKSSKTKFRNLESPAGSEFGKLMGAVMKELAGDADGDAVRKIVEEELAKTEG